MEREFNNLLALGTDRRLDDVSTMYYLVTEACWAFEKMWVPSVG